MKISTGPNSLTTDSKSCNNRTYFPSSKRADSEERIRHAWNSRGENSFSKITRVTSFGQLASERIFSFSLVRSTIYLPPQRETWLRADNFFFFLTFLFAEWSGEGTRCPTRLSDEDHRRAYIVIIVVKCN